MELRWTSKAQSDLNRLYEFLAQVNQTAAANAIQKLTLAPERLVERPRIGEILDEFQPREVRRIFAGDYEMRYEIQNSIIYLLRIWHMREQR